MQRFVSDVVWDEEAMLREYHTLVNEDLGDPEGILIFDESGFAKKGDDSVGGLGADRKYTYYISNAPVRTQLRRFVWLSGVRWAIEQCFEEAKSELGMDHYEVLLPILKATLEGSVPFQQHT